MCQMREIFALHKTVTIQATDAILRFKTPRLSLMQITLVIKTSQRHTREKIFIWSKNVCRQVLQN